MGLDLSTNLFEQLRSHVGHRLTCVAYGGENDLQNIAVECETCEVVLLDADRSLTHPPEDKSEALSYYRFDTETNVTVRVVRQEDGSYRGDGVDLLFQTANEIPERFYPEKLCDYFGNRGVWNEHSEYPRSGWAHEATDGDTINSYWKWVASQLEANEEPAVFFNYYRHCEIEWRDVWSSQCDTRCPVCGEKIEPDRSDPIEPSFFS